LKPPVKPSGKGVVCGAERTVGPGVTIEGTPDGNGNDGTTGILTDGIGGTAGGVKSLGKGGT